MAEEPGSRSVRNFFSAIFVVLRPDPEIHLLKVFKLSFQLTFNDSDIFDLLEELQAYLEGHLRVLDKVSKFLHHIGQRTLIYLTEREVNKTEKNVRFTESSVSF